MSIPPATPLPPVVFVLGVHRSGTTWLSQSFTQRGQCVPFAVRHLLEAVEGRAHTETSALARLRAAGVDRRPGDGLAVRPGVSEEYGYLLALHHGSSRTTPRSLPTLRAAISAIQQTHPGHAIVLRNPWDYAATHRLAAWFPQAHFVFVHRDPEATVGSSVDMFREFWTAPHPYGLLMSPRYRRAWASRWKRWLFVQACKRPHILARIVAAGSILAHRAHLADAARLPTKRCHHVGYAELLDRPNDRVDALLNALGIPITGPPLPAAAPRRVMDRPWLQPLVPRLLRQTARYRRARGLPDPTS